MVWSAFIAHECLPPAATAVNRPDGGLTTPASWLFKRECSSPQQAMVRSASDRARMRAACCDGVGLGGWCRCWCGCWCGAAVCRGGRAVHATARHQLGVDVEQAPIGVQQRLLRLNELVSNSDILGGGGGRRCWCGAAVRRGGRAVHATTRHQLGVDVEQAPIGVQQRFLRLNELVADSHVRAGDRWLGGGRYPPGDRADQPGNGDHRKARQKTSHRRHP